MNDNEVVDEEKITKDVAEESQNAETSNEGECEECEQQKRRGRKHKEMVTKEEFDALQEQYLKALNTAAHYENLKKQYQGDYERLAKYRSQAAMELILPALDGFQMAFNFPAPTKEAENYRMGFEFVYKLLLDSLQNEGLVSFTPKVGDVYDSSRYHAVESIPTEEEQSIGKVAEVLLNGYQLKDRLLRPASVKVYAKVEVTTSKDIAQETTSVNTEEIKN